MFKFLLQFSFLVVFVSPVHGEICVICNCSFVGITPVEPNAVENSEIITFKYKTGDVEPYNANSTHDIVQKYFYVDCSSENNVGQIQNLDWPKVKVLGIFANFRKSLWKRLESFPGIVKKHMIVLSLSDNLISEIGEFEMKDFTNLKMLNLTRNHIEYIEKGIFSNMNELRVLDLSANKIEKMDDWAFYGTELQFLNLSKNAITHLTTDVFRGLNNLKIVDLSENRLSKLLSEFGNSLPSLKVLSLRSNHLQKLPELPKELKKFDVSHNELVELNLHHSNLEVLYIDHNQLLSVGDMNLPLLKVFKASHNNMTQLTNLKSDRVEILDFSHNNFDYIPEVITSDKLPFLEELYLDGNSIINITFPVQSEPFSNLKLVSLSQLKSVKKILTDSFTGVFPKIPYDCREGNGIKLNFSHNYIKYVDKDVFQSFSVCSIDLSNNHLKTLPQNLLPWQKLSHVNLQENPWHCDCNIQWMLDDFLVFMYENHPRLLFGLRCATPLRYRNKLFVSWYNKTKDVFCNSGPSSIYLDLAGGKKVEIWTASAIACLVLGCFIFVTIVIILVLMCRPKKSSRRSKSKAKHVGPPFYKQIPNNVDEKSKEINEKYV